MLKPCQVNVPSRRRKPLPFVIIPLATSLLLVVSVLPLQGQDSDIFEPGDVPAISLSDISVARIDSLDGEVMVAIQIPKFRQATKTVRVNVTREVAEVRERVRRVEGREVTERFTVMVPIVEQVEQEVTYLAADGFSVTKTPLSSLVAKSIDGTKVSREALAERLQMPTHVFLLRGPWNDEAPPIDDYYRSVLRRDVLFIHIAQPKRLPRR